MNGDEIAKLRKDVTKHTGHLNEDSALVLDLIQKNFEYPYHDELAKITEMLPESMNNKTRLISYKDLIQKLWVPTVHYEKDECPNDCTQKTKCKCIRDVLTLIKHLLNEISKQFSIFSGTDVVIVGSLKENTKINELDEADCVLVLDKTKNFENFLEFKEESQQIVFIENQPKNDDLEPYRMENNNCFNSKKYFMTFLTSMYNILTYCGQQLPSDLSLSMDPLVTKYEPCVRCMSQDTIRPQIIRCKHKQDCNHEDNCDCTEFNSPCMSWSKIGATLHVSFSEYGINLDVDLSPPILKTKNIATFNGKNDKKRKYLEDNRSLLTGWLDEWKKSLDMMAAARAFPDSKRSIRLRLINRDTVLAEQCLMFYNTQTLEGSKKWVYVIMKILKLVTQPVPLLTSYLIKLSVHLSLSNMTPTDEQLGECIKKVLLWNSVRGRFDNSVHTELAKIGLERVEVADDGLNFIGMKSN